MITIQRTLDSAIPSMLHTPATDIFHDKLSDYCSAITNPYLDCSACGGEVEVNIDKTITCGEQSAA